MSCFTEGAEATLGSTFGRPSIEGRQPRRLLVVGDWVVDDFWVTGIHRSPTSSRTGSLHLRAQHSVTSSVQAFCGAGRTAALLHAARTSRGRAHHVTGVGLWHPDDTKVLASMFDPATTHGQTPFRLTRTESQPSSDGIRLINLSPLIDLDHGTTRIIRIYQHSEQGVSQLQRFDWEVEAPRDPTGRYAHWIDEPGPLGEFTRREGIEAESIDAVVLKDLGKGVVCEATVRWLRKSFARNSRGNIPWFISSKIWKPPWRELLRKIDVRLLLIPQVASRTAIREHDLPSWVTRSALPTRDALRVLRAAGRFLPASQHLRIFVLPAQMQVLAAEWRGDAISVALQNQRDLEPGSLTVGVNMASVLFASLIVTLLETPDQTLPHLIRDSLAFTTHWRAQQKERFQSPKDWDATAAPRLWCGSGTRDAAPESESAPDLSISTYDLKHEFDRWSYALPRPGDEDRLKDLSQVGIILEDGSKVIDLGRATTELPGYVCCVPKKQENIRKLTRAVRRFKGQTRPRSISCLVFAQPGSGKTFLVRRLAQTHGLRFLPFNITQMIDRRDLLESFDSIATGQAKNPQESFLVFWDEINADLDGHPVYSSFLAPLEEGAYVRAGKTFHVNPCLWVFASTRDAATIQGGDTKGSDFVSRLTVPDVDLRGPELDNELDRDAQKLENVYLGVSLIKTIYPDVRYVREKVLHAFHMLDPKVSPRELRKIVESFENIQYGRVEEWNVRQESLEPFEFEHTAWANIKLNDLVEIRAETGPG